MYGDKVLVLYINMMYLCIHVDSMQTISTDFQYFFQSSSLYNSILPINKKAYIISDYTNI